MTQSQKSNTKRVRADRLRASRLGAESVKASFGAVLTRRRYAELVGISLTTVRRWEIAGVVKPQSQIVLGSPTFVFTSKDVQFGRRLAAVIEKRFGEVSLIDAASELRRKS